MDVGEEVSKKELRVAARVTELSGEAVLKSMRGIVNGLAWLANRRTGKVGIRTLTKEGLHLEKTETNISNMKDFNKICKKYKVRFSAFKDMDKGDFVIFFKAANIAQMEQVMQEYAKSLLNGKDEVKKEPMAIKIQRAEERAQSMNLQREQVKIKAKEHPLNYEAKEPQR